jgi:hypothetical protein
LDDVRAPYHHRVDADAHFDGHVGRQGAGERPLTSTTANRNPHPPTWINQTAGFVFSALMIDPTFIVTAARTERIRLCTMAMRSRAQRVITMCRGSGG